MLMKESRTKKYKPLSANIDPMQKILEVLCHDYDYYRQEGPVFYNKIVLSNSTYNVLC